MNTWETPRCYATVGGTSIKCGYVSSSIAKTLVKGQRSFALKDGEQGHYPSSQRGSENTQEKEPNLQTVIWMLALVNIIIQKFKVALDIFKYPISKRYWKW